VSGFAESASTRRIGCGPKQFTMSLLMRAGLPSRIAAMVAVRETRAAFLDGTEMRAWLESNEVTAFTEAGDWPTPETAALWKRFRKEVLSRTLQKRDALLGRHRPILESTRRKRATSS